MPQEEFRTTRELLDEIEQLKSERDGLKTEKDKLADRLHEALIKQGPMESELSKLRQREQDFAWFEEAAKNITQKPSANTSVGELVSLIRAKINGLEYKVSNLEGELQTAVRLRDRYYDRTRGIRAAVQQATGSTLNWREEAVEEWIKTELPRLFAASKNAVTDSSYKAVIKERDDAQALLRRYVTNAALLPTIESVAKGRIDYASTILKDPAVVTSNLVDIITKLANELQFQRERAEESQELNNEIQSRVTTALLALEGEIELVEDDEEEWNDDLDFELTNSDDDDEF